MIPEGNPNHIPELGIDNKSPVAKNVDHQTTNERREVVHASHTEVIPSCSALLSLHCPRHPLLLALLPACAGSQVIMRQDCSAYAEEPLRTVGLLEAAHQYRVQDIHGSVSATTHT